MTRGAGRAAVVPIFAVVAGLVVLGMLAIGVRLVAALRGGRPPVAVTAVGRLTRTAGGVDVHLMLTGSAPLPITTGLLLAGTDRGNAERSGEQTTGAALHAQSRTVTEAPDRRSITADYHVAATVGQDVVYVLPVVAGIAVRRLRVEVTGGRVGSCLTRYDTTNGTPKLRTCMPSGGAGLDLDSRDQALDLVRLVLVP